MLILPVGVVIHLVFDLSEWEIALDLLHKLLFVSS